MGDQKPRSLRGPMWVGYRRNDRDRVNGGNLKSYRDAVLDSLLWPSSPKPQIMEKKGVAVISFRKEELENRRQRLKSCLVGRVVGDNPSTFALRE